MAVKVKDSGLVKTTAKEFPILAVNVLERLGYKVSRASKQLDQILANQRVDEQIGMDRWQHEYTIVMRWEQGSAGIVVSVEMEEIKGSASMAECQKRCDNILMELENDAARAAKAAGTKVKSTAYGAAEWGSEKDLQANGYFQKTADPKRLIIGRTADDRYIQVPEFWTHAHAIICGRTGVGKSRGFSSRS